MSHLIGKPAPAFTAPAAMPDQTVQEDFGLDFAQDKYLVLFFYPLDFTFVCPTEILAFDRKLEEFKELGAEVVGVSIDSHFTHMAWKRTPVSEGGIGEVRYPLVADLTKEISRAYGVLSDAGIAYRGTFLIDRSGVVRHAVVNDLGLGRNIDEALRMVKALRHHEAHGEVCPAGWTEGEEAMQPTPEGVASYLSAHAK